MSRLLTLFRARTPDHRGTLRDLMPARYLNCTPQAQSPLPLRIRNRIFMSLNRTPGGRLNLPSATRRLDRHTTIILVAGAVLALAAFAFNAFIAPTAIAGRGVVVILFSSVLSLIPFAIIGATLTHIGIRVNSKRIARAIAAEGYCPTCAYPLAEIEKAQDGCTICPECGGAWSVSEPAHPNHAADP